MPHVLFTSEWHCHAPGWYQESVARPHSRMQLIQRDQWRVWRSRWWYWGGQRRSKTLSFLSMFEDNEHVYTCFKVHNSGLLGHWRVLTCFDHFWPSLQNSYVSNLDAPKCSWKNGEDDPPWSSDICFSWFFRQIQGSQEIALYRIVKDMEAVEVFVVGSCTWGIKSYANGGGQMEEDVHLYQFVKVSACRLEMAPRQESGAGPVVRACRWGWIWEGYQKTI